MTLATAVTSGQTVTLDYTPPATNPLRDESELGAPGFTARTVTNNTPAATNNAAEGKPGITGAPQRGGTLTATIGTIADDDGLTTRTFPGDYTFQWAKDGSDIAGATSSTYDVPATETLGATFTVKVSFTDDDGNAEGPLTSDATPGTIDAPEDCATDRADSDWCATMTVGDQTSQIGFTASAGSLDDTGIEYGGQTFTVTVLTYAKVPGGVGNGYKANLDAFVPLGSVFNLGGKSLTADAAARLTTTGQYGWTDSADPDWLKDQKVTVSANLAPIVTGATVNGDTLTLTFAEDLDTNSKPAASAFTISVDGGAGANPSSVDTISGSTVTMTLATAVTSGQTVTVAYAVPTTNPLQDTSGIEAPAFAAGDFTVTNETPGGTACSADAVWCATLTVQNLGSGHRGCANSASGSACTNTAHLSEDEFTHDATGYAVTSVQVRSGGQIRLFVNPDISTASENLVLHIGDDSFRFQDADTKGNNHRYWNGSGLSWTTGEEVHLELREDTRAPATGAPAITGAAWVGQALSAGIGTIDDTDGLPGTFPGRLRVPVVPGGCRRNLQPHRHPRGHRGDLHPHR